MLKRPVIFGEVLYDVFSPSIEVLGGAPFNVAWHLQGFGVDPLFISAVGADDRGHQIKDRMQHWGMDCSGLQTDSEHPSGVVQVNISDGQPSYEILSDQAYDFIKTPQLPSQDIGLLYHGSLALRQQVSSDSLQTLRQTLSVPIFIDINLREPWWHWRTLNAMIQHAHWLKLNDVELLSLVELLAIPNGNQQVMSRALLAHYGIDTLVLTRGEKGATMVTKNEVFDQAVPQVDDLVDTVGAGDAFSSVYLLGQLHQWSEQQTLQRALQFAAQICRQRGATTEDKNIYDELKRSWEK